MEQSKKRKKSEGADSSVCKSENLGRLTFQQHGLDHGGKGGLNM
jgi:hypothetical protein